MNCLVVDDNIATASGLAGLLSSQFGAKTVVLTVTSVTEAILVVSKAEAEIDIAFLDLILPDHHGLVFLQHLQYHPSIKFFPTVVLSGISDPDVVAQCRVAGAKGFVNKINAGELIEAAVQAVLSGQDFFNDDSLVHDAKLSNAPIVLTTRLEDVARLFFSQMSNQDIANELLISNMKVKNALHELMRTFHAKNRSELMVELSQFYSARTHTSIPTLSP